MKKLHCSQSKPTVSLNLKTQESAMKIAKVIFAIGQLMVLTGVLAQTTTQISSAPTANAATPTRSSNFQLPSTQTTATVAAQLNVAKNVRRGGESGGGGSYVLVDGEIMISDRFYDSIGNIQPTPVRQVTFAQLPQAVRREAVGLIKFFQRATNAKRHQGEPITNIYNGQYFLVPKGYESQAFCNNYLPNLTRTVDDHFRFGCTNGNVTFLFLNAFERPDVDLRDQVYALLHERLWTLVPGVDQSVIASFTTALHDLEDLSMKQENDDSYVATPQELSAFSRLQQAAQGLGYSTLDVNEYQSHKTGGLISRRCGSIDLTQTLLTAGSRIECLTGRSPSLRNSRIIRSVVKEAGTVENSTIIDSFVQTSADFDDRELTAKENRWLLKFPFSIKDSTILRSQLLGTNLQGAQLVNVVAEATLIGDRFSLKDSSLRSTGNFHVGADSKLSNLRLRISMWPNSNSTGATGKIVFRPGSLVDGLAMQTQLQGHTRSRSPLLGRLIGVSETFGVEFGPAGSVRRPNLATFTDARGNILEYAVDVSMEVTSVSVP